jgi:hypothetical protein
MGSSPRQDAGVFDWKHDPDVREKCPLEELATILFEPLDRVP